ncbi:MAG: 50S ribosomal protein L29 [Bacilli bacterium]|jgi:large subunit ribosomal protein L29|nr:50S ribosomal protein L29 [Dysgonamonadaceae bacterium]HBN83219.1 50S ribosomal protein L29 [Clostridiales bacterium]MDD3308568.1 50S ribosomal protein L29 [Dysgonamonadaceae bacterium]MDD3899969.1 50S ribosomal protein L29 [Dysgonamonadaceae bacterium]MDD4398672.1 50S ribosomal protein L29 [Dysgonamonadaceae bacterium]
MKQLEIREISEKDLKEKMEIELKELNQLKINHTITPLDNPSSIKVKRRDIARMHTELRERELKK